MHPLVCFSQRLQINELTGDQWLGDLDKVVQLNDVEVFTYAAFGKMYRDRTSAFTEA